MSRGEKSIYVFICDRCGYRLEFTDESEIKATTWQVHNVDNQRYDLCPQCSRAFLEWFRVEGEEPNPLRSAFLASAVQLVKTGMTHQTSCPWCGDRKAEHLADCSAVRFVGDYEAFKTKVTDG